jgi:hypothetical protein
MVSVATAGGRSRRIAIGHGRREAQKSARSGCRSRQLSFSPRIPLPEAEAESGEPARVRKNALDCANHAPLLSRDSGTYLKPCFEPPSPLGLEDTYFAAWSSVPVDTGDTAAARQSGPRQGAVRRLASRLLGGFRLRAAEGTQPPTAELACLSRGRSEPGMGLARKSH